LERNKPTVIPGGDKYDTKLLSGNSISKILELFYLWKNLNRCPEKILFVSYFIVKKKLFTNSVRTIF